MKINQLITLFIILTSLNVLADSVPTSHTTISITPFAGYRYDVFQWSIPMGTCSTKNKASELTWKNHILETGVKIETRPEDREFSFLGQMKYGIILNNSTLKDADWDNLGEFSTSISRVKGNIVDLSGAVGVSRQLSSALITYYLGMDYTKYQMKNYGLNYKTNRYFNSYINDTLGQTHSKSQLVSKYSFDNYAPWVGASIFYPINDKISLKPTIKAYLFYLLSKADWVLRNDYVKGTSFTHRAFGTGASVDTELLYQYNQKLDIHANIGFKIFRMLEGRKKHFFRHGYTYSNDLKKLSFMSSSISGGIKYKF